MTNGATCQTVTTRIAGSAVLVLVNQGTGSNPAAASTALKTPDWPLYIHSQIRAAATPGTAQPNRSTARARARPGKGRSMASAETRPRETPKTTDRMA
jgi:hypothetical protein